MRTIMSELGERERDCLRIGGCRSHLQIQLEIIARFLRSLLSLIALAKAAKCGRKILHVPQCRSVLDPRFRLVTSTGKLEPLEVSEPRGCLREPAAR